MDRRCRAASLGDQCRPVLFLFLPNRLHLHSLDVSRTLRPRRSVILLPKARWIVADLISRMKTPDQTDSSRESAGFSLLSVLPGCSFAGGASAGFASASASLMRARLPQLQHELAGARRVHDPQSRRRTCSLPGRAAGLRLRTDAADRWRHLFVHPATIPRPGPLGCCGWTSTATALRGPDGQSRDR